MDVLEEEGSVLVEEVEDELAEDHVELLVLALAEEVLSVFVDHRLSDDEGVDAEEDAVFALRLAGSHQSVGLLLIAGAEVDCAVVVGEDVCDQRGDVVDERNVHDHVPKLRV